MIKINRETDITVLSASVTDFADSLGYCEYKIPLSIQDIKPKPSQSLILGTKAHTAEEKYEQEHVELEPVLMEEIKDEEKNIEFARENIHSTLMVPLEFPAENVLVSLSGRIDKILRVDGTLIVQDDKFTGKPEIYDQKTQPYPSQLLQVLTYLNSSYSATRSKNPEDWFDMPHTQKKWQIRICNRKTREPYKIFSDYQDAFALHYLHTSLEKFATISLGIIHPEHHNSKSKCNACNLKTMCNYRI
ncbi:PD-(D/E)XK nuclease family protein [Nitrosopumilus sp.]|uniref:PD-(D/E)XK nuclease family protein n=1 Tax=Nitrosopumilus sp. TaxID=2024843 RepID=UPI0034A00093